MGIEAVRANALRFLIPPPRLRLSEWIEGNVILPEGVSAQPGKVRLWPFQREIADAIGDPLIERVTLVKPVRVGFSTLLTAAVGSFVANEPAPILYLLPAEADCRDYVVSDVEPIFGASPVLADALSDDREEGERNTLLSRRFPGVPPGAMAGFCAGTAVLAGGTHLLSESTVALDAPAWAAVLALGLGPVGAREREPPGNRGVAGRERRQRKRLQRRGRRHAPLVHQSVERRACAGDRPRVARPIDGTHGPRSPPSPTPVE